MFAFRNYPLSYRNKHFTDNLSPSLSISYKLELLRHNYSLNQVPITIRIFLAQVPLRAEVLRTPSSTWVGFELMTSRSWQYISCHWDACFNHLAISDFLQRKHKIRSLPHTWKKMTTSGNQTPDLWFEAITLPTQPHCLQSRWVRMTLSTYLVALHVKVVNSGCFTISSKFQQYLFTKVSTAKPFIHSFLRSPSLFFVHCPSNFLNWKPVTNPGQCQGHYYKFVNMEAAGGGGEISL